MPKMPDIIPVTDLRQDAAAALKRVRATKEPLVITQRGRAAAVMLSVEAYERAEHERQILRLLARGDREIRTGKGHGLDEVMAEAGRPLADTRDSGAASRRPLGVSSSTRSRNSLGTIQSPPGASDGERNTRA